MLTKGKNSMATKIFVGKLSFDTTEQGLTDLFTAYGQVSSVAIINDRETGKSRGFGFVEMPELKEAQKAIKELDGKELDGRNIAVSAAKEREERPRSQAGYRRSW
jgi:RNA recognition motif-containing protein